MVKGFIFNGKEVKRQLDSSFDKRHVDRRQRRQHRRHPSLSDEEDKRHKGRRHRHDFHEENFCGEEDSVSNESDKSFDSIDSLIQNECGCDPCGVW